MNRMQLRRLLKRLTFVVCLLTSLVSLGYVFSTIETDPIAYGSQFCAEAESSIAPKGITQITKKSVIEGFRVSNHAWRKSGLGRGATEELVSGVIQGARKTGTVVTEVGTGKFAGNSIEVFVYNGVKVAVDTTRKIIMSIRPVSNKSFKLP